ncbi:MAG: hypothetical protein AAGJ18_11115 [Bacteroidota bacterium]
MKRLLIVSLIFLANYSISKAQEVTYKPTVAVLGVDSKNPSFSSQDLGNILRMEVSKLNRFDVLDRYDTDYLVKKNNLETADCYGKICLTEVGAKLGVEKILTGNVEVFGETFVITLRLLNVPSGNIEETEVVEFLNLPQQIRAMMQLTVQKLFGATVDEKLFAKLSQKDNYENTINYPQTNSLTLSGPRMGFTYITGATSSILKAPKTEGGFDMYPLMFQFGYQWEVKYLNQGDFQALFEIVPVITGLDQGKFFPSLSLLNGLRSNVSGWEFAFGPILFVTPEEKGFYNEQGRWIRHFEASLSDQDPTLQTRLDSRGDPRFDSSFVFAIGKSFKSGNLNIPVNLFFIPQKDGSRVGISVGFNATR